jgi:hypothetical protein
VYTRLALLLLAAVLPRAGSGGVTVALPPGWHSTKPDDGRVTQPVTRLVVSSGPIRPSLTRGCQVSAYDFPANAVAVVVVEWTKPIGGMKLGAGPGRPRHFRFAIRPPPSIECWPGPGGATEWAEHGRSFAAYVLLGRRAPRALAARALAVLDTLRVARR